MLLRANLFGCLLLATTMALGCGQGNLDPQVQAGREKLLMATEPANARTLSELILTSAPGSEVVVVGQIGGVPDPWISGNTAFVIADENPQYSTASVHHHCGDGCKFCAQRAATPTVALVRLVNEQGELWPYDARYLLGLSEKQTVVVKGRLDMAHTGHVIIAADGVFIRR